jgi:hypothetical protein
MKYLTGFKFVVFDDFSRQTNIKGFNVTLGLTSLDENGLLSIRKNFAWDGSSAPILDFRSTLEGSCDHDALCDMVNQGLLPSYLQPIIDQVYYDVCREKGFPEILARIRLIVIRWYQTGKGAKRFHRKVQEA